MKNFLNTLTIIFVALCLAGCGGRDDASPMETALSESLSHASPNASYLEITSFEVVDSTSLGEEYAMRTSLFETKLAVLTSQYEKYVREKKVNNAAKKKEEMEETVQVQKRLADLSVSLASKSGKTVYYDCRFSAIIRGNGGMKELKDWYACITPENEVLVYCENRKDLHKTTGKVIPGYVEALKGLSE